MNAPLATLPILPAGSGTEALVQADSSLNQSVGGDSTGFGAFLGEAVANRPLTGDPAQPALDDAQKLLLQLQELPQGGKLLPLLRQVMSQAGEAGGDPQRMLQAFSGRVEKLQVDGTQDLVQQAALVLQQLSAEIALPAQGSPTMQAHVDQASRIERQRLLTPLAAAGQGATVAIEEDINAPQALENGVPKPSLAERTTMPLPVVGGEPRLNPDEFVKRLGESLARLSASEGTAPRTEAGTRIDALNLTSGYSGITPSSSAGTGLPSSVSSTGIALPLNHAHWDQAMSERVQWMVGQRVQSAHIRLNPENLGPMEVRLSMNNDQASVQFVSAHGVVREALDAAIPRLRDMLEASGVQLLDVNISDQSMARNGGEGDAAPLAGDPNGKPPDNEDISVSQTTVGRVLEQGRLDLFA